VTDYFSLLHLPRRPWLEPQDVQERFLALSAEVHPDRVHNAPAKLQDQANARFAELNAAARCLRDPKQRLRHLLELERSAPVSNLERLPSAEADFYFELGPVLRDADAFLASQAKAVSPLAKARFFQAAMEWRERLENLQQKLNERRQRLDTDLKSLNTAWESAPGDSRPLDRVEQAFREFGYVTRWTDQIRDRIVQLIV
jgi:curved DNA-binding protein CbpA